MLAFCPSCQTLVLQSTALYLLNLVMTVQIALFIHARVLIMMALIMYFMGAALPTSLNMRQQFSITNLASLHERPGRESDDKVFSLAPHSSATLCSPSSFSQICFYIFPAYLPPFPYIPTSTPYLSQSYSFAILNPVPPISITSAMPTPPPSTYRIRHYTFHPIFSYTCFFLCSSVV